MVSLLHCEVLQISSWKKQYKNKQKHNYIHVEIIKWITPEDYHLYIIVTITKTIPLPLYLKSPNVTEKPGS